MVKSDFSSLFSANVEGAWLARRDSERQEGTDSTELRQTTVAPWCWSSLTPLRPLTDWHPSTCWEWPCNHLHSWELPTTANTPGPWRGLDVTAWSCRCVDQEWLDGQKGPFIYQASGFEIFLLLSCRTDGRVAFCHCALPPTEAPGPSQCTCC